MPTFKIINTFNGVSCGEFSSFGAAESAVEVMCMNAGDDADHEIHCDDGRKWVWQPCGDDSGFYLVAKRATNAS